MGRPLEQRPLLVYPTPNYPDHTHPDPSAELPFPASSPLMRAMAGTGVLAAVGALFAPNAYADGQGAWSLPTTVPTEPDGAGSAGEGGLGSGDGTGGDDAMEGVGLDETGQPGPAGNPFERKDTGLPHAVSVYGTGQPNRLDGVAARDVIERVFREEGVNLQPSRKIADGPLSFTADGYDPVSGIGYVFGDYGTLDTDAWSSWQRGPPPKATDPDKLSLDEIDRVNNRAARDGRFIAVISQYDRRFEYYGGGMNSEEYDAYNAATDDDERTEIRMKAHRRGAEGALAELETNVREYIRWSRNNGAL